MATWLPTSTREAHSRFERRVQDVVDPPVGQRRLPAQLAHQRRLQIGLQRITRQPPTSEIRCDRVHGHVRERNLTPLVALTIILSEALGVDVALVSKALSAARLPESVVAAFESPLVNQ